MARDMSKLATYEECRQKKNEKKADILEEFILDFTPCNPEDAENFRHDLSELVYWIQHDLWMEEL
jgi:hypothetical protein